MYDEKISHLFKKYAVPQMVGLLFNSVYLIVDGIFIGNRLGRDSMAAAAISVPFIEVLLSIAMAVASGAGIMISISLGKKDKKSANKILSTSVWLLFLISIAIVVFCNIFLHPLANFLGSTPDIHNESVKYLWYVVTFSPFLLFSFLLGGLVRNDGRPKLAMIALAFGSISNIVLDYVFMYPLNMGISGAALATALGPIFSVLILLPHFLRKKGSLHFEKPNVNMHDMKRILKFGFPSFIMEFTIGIITLIYNFAIIKNGYGEIGLAAYLVIGYLMLIILTIFLGMAEGLQPVFSYFSGTNALDKNKEMLTFASKVFLAIGILCNILILLFSRKFYRMFTPNDIQLINFATEKSILYFSGFSLAGINILYISYWQSIQHTKSALLISFLRSLVLPPLLIMILPIIFGSESIWISYSVAEVFTAFVTLSLWYIIQKSSSLL